VTPDSLARAASEALAKGLDNVMLVLPRRATGGRRMVVFARPRLYGEVACETPDGRTTVWVDAADLLAWLASQGLVRVEVAP